MSARAPTSRLKHEQSAGLRNAGSFARRNQLADHVHRPVRAGGEPLDHATRSVMERGFNHDFSRVRLHADARAAQFAAALGARAYTVGSNVVFASGAFAPASRAGQALLAHELAHVVQNERHGPATPAISTSVDASEHEAGRAARSVLAGGRAAVSARPDALVQRLTPGEQAGLGFLAATAVVAGLALLIAGTVDALESETFTDEELLAYLAKLERDGPERGINSDNKARAVVRRWQRHADGFTELIVPIRIHLINEMADGDLSDADQVCILALLREAIPVERARILWAIDADKLALRFDGDRRKYLESMIKADELTMLALSHEWTVPETKRVIMRQGDGGLLGQILRLGYRIFRFVTAFDTWILPSGRILETPNTTTVASTDTAKKRIYLRGDLDDESAAARLYHEAKHATSPDATSPQEKLAAEVKARQLEEGFRYRHGLAPAEPEYRKGGEIDVEAIRKDVAGSPLFGPTGMVWVDRRYVGEKETFGWEL